MGKVIPFYHPIVRLPVAALTLATQENDAEWKAQCAEEALEVPAADVLKKCLENTELDQVLVLTCDKDGVFGFQTNCEDLAESVLFIELVKAKMLFSREAPGGIA